MTDRDACTVTAKDAFIAFIVTDKDAFNLTAKEMHLL